MINIPIGRLPYVFFYLCCLWFLEKQDFGIGNVTALYLRHSSFSNPSVASHTSQLILQPFFRFSYITGSSRTSPGEPPMVCVCVCVCVCVRARAYVGLCK